MRKLLLILLFLPLISYGNCLERIYSKLDWSSYASMSKTGGAALSFTGSSLFLLGNFYSVFLIPAGVLALSTGKLCELNDQIKDQFIVLKDLYESALNGDGPTLRHMTRDLTKMKKYKVTKEEVAKIIEEANATDLYCSNQKQKITSFDNYQMILDKVSKKLDWQHASEDFEN